MTADGYSLQLQLERTVLSWNRSALAIAANGGLLTHEGFLRDVPALAGLGLAVIAGGAVLWVASVSRYGAARNQQATHLIAHREWSVLMLTAFTIVLSGIDLVLAVT